MNAVFGTALSGLMAAERRVQVSATNVANLGARGPVDDDGNPPRDLYQPQQVVQTTDSTGAPQTVVKPVDPAAQVIADPSQPTGKSAIANIDLAAEMVEQQTSTIAYQANASVLVTAQQMDETLLDIKA